MLLRSINSYSTVAYSIERFTKSSNMTHVFPMTILSIHRKPAAPENRPSTLTQIEKSLSQTVVNHSVLETHPHHPTYTANSYLKYIRILGSRLDTNLFHITEEIESNQLSDLVNAIEKTQPEFLLSLSCKLEDGACPEFVASGKNSTITQIQWHVSGQLPPLPFFKSLSGYGVWNHLVSDNAVTARKLERLASLQPNIIHSWENTGSTKCAAGNTQGVYHQVAQLPGRPLWWSVNDPIHRLVLLAGYGKNWLLRSRVDVQNNRLYEIGEDLEYHFCPPDDLPEGYLKEICAMVAAGGTVATTHVRFNLERAYLIGYVLEKGVIVGNSSLKNPRPAYIDTVQRQSGLDLTGYVERGYTSVRPEYRGLGIGTKLLEGLTKRAGDRRIFSVIGEDNKATKIIAKRNRSRKVATYFSEKAGKPVGIWMPEWMIDP